MAERPKLVVIGSANLDMVVQTAHIPDPGETVLGGAFVTASGGKGANQAVAAARLGANVTFLGRIGADVFGDTLLAALTSEGICLDYLRRDAEQPTGVALIGVDAQGQNAIIVAPGANGKVRPEDVDAARACIAEADAVVLQLEIPQETVAYAVTLAKSVGTRVILNPAPIDAAHPLPDELLRQVDVLIPNEHEAVQLLGMPSAEGRSWEEIAELLLAKGVGTVLITLGEEGCLLAAADETLRIPAFPVTPLDTTAAGDCFTGALAVALAEGLTLLASAHFATRAAALSVTRRGAQPSLPTRAEVNNPGERLSFEASWKLLQQTTTFVREDEPFPLNVGPAGWDSKGCRIEYHKYPEINVPADGEKYGLWRLENLTMPSVFFCRCGIEDISFRNSSLVESFLCWNDFINIDFTNADLSRCDMRCSYYKNVQFVRAELCGADLRMATFENCDFTDANMTGTKLTPSQAENLSLSAKQKEDVAWQSSDGEAPPGG